MANYLMASLGLVVLFIVGVICQSCDPDCSLASMGDLVSDPKNCSQYFVCLSPDQPSSAPVECDPTTSMFDGAKCVTDDGSCTPNCVPSLCHFTCDAVGDFVADPLKCSQYYACMPTGLSAPFVCPTDKPFFDSIHKVCVADETVCCTDLCTPYCSVQYSQIPDPDDCTMFYICMEVGLANAGTNLHTKCPAGENFDIVRGVCSPDVPCTTLCGEGPAGTTRSPNTPASTEISSTLKPFGNTTPTPPTTPKPFGNTTPTPPTTPSPSGCLDSLMCTKLGFFAACSTCQQKYFRCTAVGQLAKVEYCIGQLVFDTNPNYAYCVIPPQCPSA